MSTPKHPDPQRKSLSAGGRSTGWSRRQFLNTATAAGAGALLAGGCTPGGRGGTGRYLSGQPIAAPRPGRVLGANDRIVLGIIGAGGMGRGHMNNFLKVGGTEWAAVCDVFEPNLNEGLKIAGEKAKGYRRHEELLDRHDIDAVLIASPEHWHHDHLIDAVRAGKDAYCEKPMCWSIQQGQEMIDAVRRTDRIVQIGMQRRSAAIIRDNIKKVFDEGTLGKVHLVRAEWYWNWKVDPNAQVDRSKLDWERFCGPAGRQEYHPLKFRYWRYYWPFSGGNETDQGTHLMDVVQWMMNADQPLSAVQWGAVYENHPTITPDTFCCTFEYPDFMCTWTLGYTTNTWRNGWSITFQGTAGALFLTEAGYRVFNQVNGWEKGWPKPKVEELPGSVTDTVPHIRNFLECVRSRKQPNAPVEIGHRAVRPLHLANAALKKGRRAHLGKDGVTITYS
ncbi:MAG: Gfo/Idh/MocA family oxidoreductase [Phycisphaerae bacterium]|jgi:predicted dehydrogenase